jgi:rhomboid protease GluP
MVDNDSNSVPSQPRPDNIEGEEAMQQQQEQDPQQQQAEEPAPFVYGRGTLLIVGLNVFVFIGMCVTNGIGSFTDPSPEARLLWGANYGPITTQGEWWRLIACTFVHDGIMHIGMNMAIFSYIGSIVERLFGTPRFLGIYLLSGLGASAASMYVHPDVLSVGASGAVLGCLGAFIAFLKRHRSEINAEYVASTLRSFVTLAAIIVLAGFWRPGTDNFAHIGGLITGALVGFALMPKQTPDVTH